MPSARHTAALRSLQLGAPSCKDILTPVGRTAKHTIGTAPRSCACDQETAAACPARPRRAWQYLCMRCAGLALRCTRIMLCVSMLSAIVCRGLCVTASLDSGTLYMHHASCPCAQRRHAQGSVRDSQPG